MAKKIKKEEILSVFDSNQILINEHLMFIQKYFKENVKNFMIETSVVHDPQIGIDEVKYQITFTLFNNGEKK